MESFLSTVTWLLVFYFAYCAFLFFMQRRMLFPTHFVEAPQSLPNNINGLEQVWLNGTTGRVEAWIIPPDNRDKPMPAVIFAHGNAEIIDHWPGLLDEFAGMDIALMLVEYPGYGRSTGASSQDEITQVFMKAYDSLIERDYVDDSRIILFGRSLGGGAVCQLALKRPSAALILSSTFKSAKSFAARYLAPGILMRDPFDNLEVVEKYPGPVLVIHGKNDMTVPYKHGVTLSESAKNGTLISYNAGHNDCPPDWPVFWKDLRTFLKENNIIYKDNLNEKTD